MMAKCQTRASRSYFAQPILLNVLSCGPTAGPSFASKEDRRWSASNSPAADGWRSDRQAHACAPSRPRRQGSGAPCWAALASADRLCGPRRNLPCAGRALPHGRECRRTVVLRPGHFAAPDRDAVAHATGCELEPKIRPVGCAGRVMEARLAVEAVEIGADELAVFHANAAIIDQIGHAAGGIDLIVGTAGGACFRLDNLDAVFERLLDDDDAREASVWRAVCNIELHFRAPSSPGAEAAGCGPDRCRI